MPPDAAGHLPIPARALTPAGRCVYARTRMEPGATIRKRYKIIERIGRGAQGETWRAEDSGGGGDVVLKIYDLSGAEDWGGFDRFENETKVLRSIDFPRIPDYIDHFDIGSDGEARFVLVQEYVDGTTIDGWVAEGRRAPVTEIMTIAADLLETIDYIHKLSPPVIHRDINPRNVIIDSRNIVYLVDFGGVQDLLKATGSTVIGTPGYVPIEQFSGRATVRSDLYAYAATMLYLLTHRNPADLPVRGMKIDLDEAYPEVRRNVRMVLDSYLEPDETRRTLSVSTAIELLRGSEHGPVATIGYERRDVASIPQGSRIRHETFESGVERVIVPPALLRGGGMFLLPFAIFWNGFVAVWTIFSMSMGAPTLFSLFSLPFWAVGIGMLYKVFLSLFQRTEIEIVPVSSGAARARFRLTRKMGPIARTIDLPVEEIGTPAVDSAYLRNGKPVEACIFEAGVKKIRLGEHLSGREKKWLCDFIELRTGDAS